MSIPAWRSACPRSPDCRRCSSGVSYMASSTRLTASSSSRFSRFLNHDLIPMSRVYAPLGARWSQHRELVGDLQSARAEAVQLGRPTACAAGGAALAGRFEDAAAQEDSLEVRGRDLVPEGGDVDLPKLRERELRRSEREADVRVRELRGRAVRGREHDRAVVESELREAGERVPPGVLGYGRVDAGGNEAE